MNPKHLLARVQKVIARFSYGDQVRPLRDWFIVIAIALLLLAGSAGWSYYLFERTSASDILGPVGTAAGTVNTASLDTVREVFLTRAGERVHYQTDYHFVDPSR